MVGAPRLIAVLMLLLVAGIATTARAQEAVPTAADWKLLGPPEPIHRLYTPASGALLAAGADRLLRSDDAGATWHEVSLPPGVDLSFNVGGGSYDPPPLGPGRLAVDPTNHDVVYVAAEGGLHKTADGGASWTPLPIAAPVVALAVSPANPAYVHIVVQPGPREWRRLRSRDGGASWVEMGDFTDRSPSNRPPLDYAVYFLYPHPTDPERIFVAAGGTTGRSTQVSLYDGYDGRGPRPGPELQLDPGYFRDAEHLVGGGGAPGRYYAAFNDRVSPYDQGTSTRLLRAQEGGPQQTLLDVAGGGSLNGRQDGELLEPAVFVDALAYDPAAPDRIYVGLNEYEVTVKGSGWPQSVQLTRSRGRVLASPDGGSTWTDLGRADLGAKIRHLALGIDRANLYAATDNGIFRLPMDAAAIP